MSSNDFGLEIFELLSNKWSWLVCYVITLALLVVRLDFRLFDLLAPVSLATLWLLAVSLVWVISSLSIDKAFFKSQVDIKYKSFRVIYINLNLPAVLKEGKFGISLLGCFLFILVSQITQWSLYDTMLEFVGTNMYLAQGIVFHLFFVALPEEIFFRGMFYRNFPHSYISYAVVGSFLFGILHFSSGLSAVLIAICAGVFLCTLRWLGTSVTSLIVAHSTVNILNNILFSFNTPKYSDTIITLSTCTAFIAVTLTLKKIVRRNH